jgi:hypothetical protein
LPENGTACTKNLAMRLAVHPLYDKYLRESHPHSIYTLPQLEAAAVQSHISIEE